MSTIGVKPPFAYFTDTAGLALEAGYIYIGVENLDPIANPVAVFWDYAMTIPAAQPVRTIGGYPSRTGSAGTLYTGNTYSILVRDKTGRLIYSAPTMVDTGDVLRSDLASTASDALGDALVGVKQPFTGAVATTEHEVNSRTISVFDFLSTAQKAEVLARVVTLDTTGAIQAAVDRLNLMGGGRLLFPAGLYLLKGSYVSLGGGARVTDGVKIYSNIDFVGEGDGSEIRVDTTTCVCAFTTRLLAAITDVSQAPHDIGFYNLRFSQPGQTWDVVRENTAHLQIGAVNRLTVRDCSFVGWFGDAIMLGDNDDAGLTTALQTYIKDVEISSCFFDGVTKNNRQGITALFGENLSIHHNVFTRTTRSTMPGAIDIEPPGVPCTWGIVSDISIHDNVFDDIGGTTGAVSFALGHSLTTPATRFSIRDNKFKNITNTSDLFFTGKSATNHTAVASGSPSLIDIIGNDFSTGTSRKLHFGGVKNIKIERNTINGGTGASLFGWDDGGSNHYPVDGLEFRNNTVRDYQIPGAATDAPFFFFGGIQVGVISGNTFINCGNTTGGNPQNMTVLQWTSNGVASANVVIKDNAFINTTTFSVYSYPIYAATLTNPTTFTLKNNVFVGLNEYAYSTANSMYWQPTVVSDYYQGWIEFPSSSTPSVGGGSRFNAVTGDTITNFTSGKEGQTIQVLSTSSGATFTDNATIFLAGSTNVTMGSGAVISFIRKGTVWYETGRSVN